MYHSWLSSTIKISEGLFYPYVTKSMAFVQTEITVHYEGLPYVTKIMDFLKI